MNRGTISATVSEKTKRGRPRMLGADTIAPVLRDVVGLRGGKSRRADLNHMWAHEALDALHSPRRPGATLDPAFAWLCVGEAWRPTLLAELGRLGDREQIRRVATQLCVLRPTTADGVRLVRDLRMGRARDLRVRARTHIAAGSGLDLMLRVLDVVDAFARRHQVGREVLRASLEQALAAVEGAP